MIASRLKIFADPRRGAWLFYGIWILFSLIQAYFTELTGDEAYYWKYSQQLDWGYFDHPPAIAFFIRLGYTLIPNELGVRLFPILLLAGSIFFLQKLIRPRERGWFFALIVSVGALHFLGFLALPDAPLLFFASLLLWLFKRYLEQPSWSLATWIGLAAGAMVLSKYHALLMIGLLVLSRLRLLLEIRFWWASLVAALILLPHLLWQLEHQFPSIQYHLFERSVKDYTFEMTSQYLLFQPFVLGPVTGILFFIAAWRSPNSSPFDRAMKFLFWGGYLFFFLMTFKGRVEAHWTFFCLLPGIWFGYHWLERSRIFKKIITWSLPVVLFLVLTGTLTWSFGLFIPRNDPDFMNGALIENRLWVEEVEALAGDLPVLFMNTYGEASLYEFYTGRPAASWNNISGRKNQFDLWGYEKDFFGRRVMVVVNYIKYGEPFIPGVNPRNRQYVFIDDFKIYEGLKMTANGLRSECRPGEVLPVKLKVEVPEEVPAVWSRMGSLETCINYQFFSGDQVVHDWPTPIYFRPSDIIREIEFYVLAPSRPGTYGLHFSLQTEWYPPGINSSRYEIVVREE